MDTKHPGEEYDGDDEMIEDPESESEEEEEEEEEKEELADDPVTQSMKHETYKIHKQEFDEIVEGLVEEGISEESAARRAHNQLAPSYRKTFRKLLARYMTRYLQFKRGAIYKLVSDTAKELRFSEDFGPEESLKCAIQKRKFKLNEQFPSDEEDSDEMEEEGADDDEK